jgi:hypothetical protein
LILKNGKIISVLEIKCPSSCKKKPIIDAGLRAGSSKNSALGKT